MIPEPFKPGELRKKKIIAVCCAATPPAEEIDLAYRTGAEIAKRGAILVCGGLGGSMEAACKGAHDNGGLSIGIIPFYEKKNANEYVDIVIPTGLGHARNNVVVATADGVIGVGGSWGTLSELAIAVKMDKPVAVVKGWSASGPGGQGKEIAVASTPEEAVELVMR
jgi:uncharacterized protein (TIGR00725 family)